MRPITGVKYHRAVRGLDQSHRAVDCLIGSFDNSNSMILSFRDLTNRLKFGTSAPVFEETVKELGSFLGFEAQRPERDTGSGPDVLWSLGELRFLVIECKSEAKSDVWKRDAGQLAQSMSWFADKYDSTCEAIPVLIHHSGRHASNATPLSGERVIDERRLGDVRDSLEQYGRTPGSPVAY